MLQHAAGRLAAAFLPILGHVLGQALPPIGFSIGGLGEDTGKMVSEALRAGFRLFDSTTSPLTADTGNLEYHQAELGAALHEARASVTRAELTLLGKVHPQDFGHDATLRAVERTLFELQTEYVDVMLLQWPYCSEAACGRTPPMGGALDAYLALEEARAYGLVRSVGLANFDAFLLQDFFAQLAAYDLPSPGVLQIPADPFRPPAPSLLKIAHEHGMAVQVFGLLGNDITAVAAWHDILQDRRKGSCCYSPVASQRTIQKVAHEHDVEPTVVPYAWSLAHGWTPLCSPANLEDIWNLASRFLVRPSAESYFRLSHYEVQSIDDLEGYIRFGIVPHHAFRNPFDRYPIVDPGHLTVAATHPEFSCPLESPDETLRLKGFQVARGLLDSNALASAHRVIHRLLRDYSFDFYGATLDHLPPIEEGSPKLLPASLFHPSTKFDFELWDKSVFDPASIAWMAPLVLNTNLLDFASCLLQTQELRLLHVGYIRAMPPGYASFDWHQDWKYYRNSRSWSPVPVTGVVGELLDDIDSTLDLFIPLTPAGNHSGGLIYSEGSNQFGIHLKEWSPTYGDLLEANGREQFGVRDENGQPKVSEIPAPNGLIEMLPSLVPVEFEPGDVVGHRMDTFHRTQNNTSDRVRWTLELQFQDARRPRGENMGVDTGHISSDVLVRSFQHPEQVLHSTADFVQLVLREQSLRG